MPHPNDKIDEADSDTTILSVFLRRKKSFLDSLEKILTSTGNDRFIIQMFEDPSSAMYVPDRVCELIERYLTNDREMHINELYQRIRTYEACFGLKKAKKIESIGTKILEQMELKNLNPPINQDEIKRLRKNLYILNSDSDTTAIPTDRLTELKEQIDSLKIFINDSKASIHTFHEDIIRKLYQTKHSLSISVESFLQESNGKATNAIAGYKSMEKKFKSENSKLQARYQSEIDQHVQNEMKYEKEILKMRQKYEILSQQNNMQQKEIETYKNRIMQLQNSNENKNQIITEKTQLEKEISQLKIDIKAKDTQIQKILESQSNKNEIDISLQSALAKSRLLNTKRAEQVQKLKEALKSLSMEYENVSHELSLARADSELTDVKLNRVTQLENEKQKFLNRITELETEKDSLERKVNEFSNESIILKEDNERMRKMMKNSSLDNLKTGNLINVIDQLNSKINENEAKIVSQQNDIDNLKTQNDTLKLKYQIQEQKNKECNETIDKLKKELDDVNNEITENQKSISQLNSNTRKYDMQVNELKSKLAESENKCKELGNALKEKEFTKTETDKEIEKLKDENSQLKTKNKILQDDIESVKDDLNQKNSVLKDFLTADQSQKSQNSKLMNEYVLLQRTAGTINAQLRSAQRDLKSKDQELEIASKKVDNLKERLKSKDDLTKQLKINLDETSKRLNSLIAQQTEMQQFIDEMKEENNLLRDKMGQANTNCVALQDQLTQESLEKDKMKKDIREMKEKQMSDYAKFEKKIENLQNENIQLSRKKSEDQNTIEKLNYTISKLEKDNKQKDDELQFEKEKFQREMKRKDDLIEFERDKSDKSFTRSQELLDIEKARMTQEQTRLLQAKDSQIAALTKRLNDEEKHNQDLEQVIRDGANKVQVQLTEVLDKNSALKKEKQKLLNELTKANTLVEAIGAIMNTKEKEKLPIVIDEAKRKSNQNDEVKKLFGFTDNSDLVDDMRDIKKTLKILKERNSDLLSLFPNANDTNLVDAVKIHKKAVDDVSKLFPSPSVDDLANVVSDVVSKVNNATKILGVTKSDDLGLTLKQLIKQNNDLQKTNDKLLEVAGCKNIDEYNATLKMYKANDDVLRKLLPGSKDPMGEISSMKGKYDKISAMLGGEENAEENAMQFNIIKPKFDEIKKILGGASDKLIFRAKELAEAEPYKRKFADIATKLGGEQNVKKAVDELIELKEMTDQLTGGNIKAIDKLRNYITEHRKLEEQHLQILDIVYDPYGDNISKAVENLKSDLKSAAELFEKLMAVLSGAEKPPFKFKFPLDPTVRDNLIVLIGQFKIETEETTRRINSILGEARKDGYVGTNIIEAVEFISHARMDEARDEATKSFQAEVSALRENYEVIVKKSDDETKRYIKKIEEMSAIIDEHKTKSIEHEKEVLLKVEKANKAARTATSNLDKEKKIREELIRIISDKPFDIEFLRANISSAEFKIIQTCSRSGFTN